MGDRPGAAPGQAQGFGHIGFPVPDPDAAIACLDPQPVNHVKRPEQGKMKNVAFIQDPGGDWMEIVEPARLRGLGR